ncbi:MAG: hypothetical protein H7Z10_09610 [Gemmatimonadaceae bacterium]|nr:hypothetical protein [Acetobacteraceae bacterium]
MIRLAPWLLLLGACSAASPADQSCERVANEDPAVKELIIKGTGNPYFQSNSQQELAIAKQDAFLACQRSRGLIPRGGVERQKPL